MLKTDLMYRTMTAQAHEKKLIIIMVKKMKNTTGTSRLKKKCLNN